MSANANSGGVGKWIVFGFVAVIAILLLVFLPKRCKGKDSQPLKKAPIKNVDQIGAKDTGGEGAPVQDPDIDESNPDQSTEKTSSAGQARTAEELVRFIRNALADGNIEQVERLIGTEVLTSEKKAHLLALIEKGRLAPSDKPIREIGQLQPKRLSRWAIPLMPLGESPTSPLLIDVAKNDENLWEASALRLPNLDGTADASQFDSLDICHAFLEAVQAQDMEKARAYTNTSSVSDVKMAALFILFEDGGYRLASQSPLRAMIQKEKTAAYLVQLTNDSSGKAGQFGINLKHDSQSPWKINELNLDSVLEKMAKRMGGNSPYVPLLKTPQGGETLVLYFEFDSAELPLRLEKQLSIVSTLMKADSKKTLRISGHADALGTNQYNDGLSLQRAKAVKKYLTGLGVSPQQIITTAEGESRPLKPNTTATGEDNPEGRRVNRRTEIYLDF